MYTVGQMGIENNTYLFYVGIQAKKRSVKYCLYNGNHSGTDIHNRTLVCGIFVLFIFGLFYGVAIGNVYMETN